MVKASLSAVVAIVAIAALCAYAANQDEIQLEQKDVGNMKFINKLMHHLDKLSEDARKGEEKDKTVSVKMKEMDDESDDSSIDAPSSVKHGISHVSHALKEAEDAENTLKSSDSSNSHHTAKRSKAQIAAKMRALQEQIMNDFKKVTGFGNKAGYLPPVKMPHV